MMIKIFFLILYFALFPFLFTGIINRVKAIWCGRKGYPLLQPFYDFLKLVRKEEIVSASASRIFMVAPVVSFAAVLFAALVVPGPSGRSLVHFDGDYLFFAYLLSLAKFSGVLGAMDTGSSFEGMGASREISYTAMVEPAYMIVSARRI